MEANGQCSKGDNCSFRHDINKRAKTTQPNPSPNSFMRQTAVQGFLHKNFHSVKSGILQNACSARKWMQILDNAFMRIVRLMNSPARRPQRMVTKVQWCVENYTTIGLRISIWSRRSLHRFYGRAQTY